MKFHVTRREQLTLCAFIIPKPTANLEQAHVRMRAWEELGVADLAMKVADQLAVGQGPDVKEWSDNVTPVLVDVTQPTVDFLLRSLDGEVPGVFSELLRRFQDRLVSLRDRNYKLPPELRQDRKKPASSDDAPADA